MSQVNFCSNHASRITPLPPWSTLTWARRCLCTDNRSATVFIILASLHHHHHHHHHQSAAAQATEIDGNVEMELQLLISRQIQIPLDWKFVNKHILWLTSSCFNVDWFEKGHSGLQDHLKKNSVTLCQPTPLRRLVFGFSFHGVNNCYFTFCLKCTTVQNLKSTYSLSPKCNVVCDLGHMWICQWPLQSWHSLLMLPPPLSL